MNARPNIIRPEQWIDADTERDARHAETARQMQIARQTDAPMGYVMEARNAQPRRDWSGPVLAVVIAATLGLFLWVGLAPEHAFGVIVGEW